MRLFLTIAVTVLLTLLAGFYALQQAQAQQASFIILTGGGGKYIKPVGSLWGLQWPGLATSTTGCLAVSSTGWVSANGSACGSGGGSGAAFPFTPQAWGNSTSTTIGFTNGLIANASSTFSSTLFLSSLTNSGLAVNSSGQVYAAATTTFSGALTHANGAVTCNTASGSQAGCLSTTDWTTFNNKVSSTSLSALYPFSGAGNSTSTLTQFNGGLTAYASSTIGSGTQAGGLTISGGATTTGNQYIVGSLGIGTTSPGTTLSVNGTGVVNGAFFSGVHTAPIFIATSTLAASTFPFASTTGITVSGTASSTSLIVSGLNSASCDVKASTSGVLSCGTDSTGSGGSAYPFTPTSNFGVTASATSTQMLLTAGLSASSTVRFGDTGLGNLTWDSANVRLGLGSSSPLYPFSISRSDSGVTPVIVLNNTGAFSGGEQTIDWYNSGDGGNFTIARLGSIVGSGYADAYFRILVSDSAKALQERLRITVSGNVGIGTAVPSYRLDVAGSIRISSSGTLLLATSTSPTLGAQGALSFDTSSNNIVSATTTANHFVVASATTTLYSFVMASTSPDFRSAGTIELPAHFLGQRATGIICEADAGTSVVVNLSDAAGSADTNAVTCTTTSTQFPIQSNGTYAAYATPRLELGTVTGAVDYLSIRVVGYRISD